MSPEGKGGMEKETEGKGTERDSMDPEPDVHHLEREIIVARTTEDHKPGLFAVSEKIWEGEDYIPTVWDEWINEDGFYTILIRDQVVGCMKYTRLPRN